MIAAVVGTAVAAGAVDIVIKRVTGSVWVRGVAGGIVPRRSERLVCGSPLSTICRRREGLVL